MDETLIVYDNSGTIFSQITGNFAIPNGLQHIIISIPRGKIVAGVDTETHEAILVDEPKSDIEILRAELRLAQEAIAELHPQFKEDINTYLIAEGKPGLKGGNILADSEYK